MRTFEEALAYGREGELMVKAALEARGHYVIDLASLPGEEGHGPRVHARGDAIVPGDLEAVLMPWRVRALLQVKRKGQACLGRITGELEHGIDWRDWREYLTLEQRFDTAVFLVIVEDSTALILAQRIKALKPRGDCPTWNGRDQMAYFLRSQFAEDGITRLERYAERIDQRART